MSINTYLLKINVLTLLASTTSFGMIFAPKLHTVRQQPKLSNKRPLFFSTSLYGQLNANKPLLLLKNEPESQEVLLYDNMLSNDTKKIIMVSLDFKSDRAYCCTNKENNKFGYFNWQQRLRLNPLFHENFDPRSSKIPYTIKEYAYRSIEKGYHDRITAAVAIRSHEQLKRLLKTRESCFAKGMDYKSLPFQESIRIAKLLARKIDCHSKIEFFERNDCVIPERNMAAMELLLEHQCNLHNISKESFKKVYNIPGYQKYLDSQVKEFLKEISESLKWSDAQYFKLLVKCIHPDIINHPMQKDEQEVSIQKMTCLPEVFTAWNYAYENCRRNLYLPYPYESKSDLNWSLLHFLQKHGALTYNELMASPPQTKKYGFKPNNSLATTQNRMTLNAKIDKLRISR